MATQALLVSNDEMRSVIKFALCKIEKQSGDFKQTDAFWETGECGTQLF